MRSDHFMRPTRMVHRFGESEKLDIPLGGGTFPVSKPDLSHTGGGNSGPLTIQQHGQYRSRTR